MLDCYMALSSDSVFAKDVLRGSSVKVRPKLVALESVDPGCWGLKPKLHLWLELRASGTSPSLFWTYRDEACGGTCALGTQERRAFERHRHFQGLARPFLDQRACATPLSSRIFSAQSCFSFLDLHKQCSGVVTWLFGNTPLTARASKCLPIRETPPPACLTPILDPGLLHMVQKSGRTSKDLFTGSMAFSAIRGEKKLSWYATWQDMKRHRRDSPLLTPSTMPPTRSHPPHLQLTPRRPACTQQMRST